MVNAITKYVASDGEQFDTRADAELHNAKRALLSFYPLEREKAEVVAFMSDIMLHRAIETAWAEFMVKWGIVRSNAEKR